MERKANFSSKTWRLWCFCPRVLQCSHPKAAEISTVPPVPQPVPVAVVL